VSFFKKNFFGRRLGKFIFEQSIAVALLFLATVGLFIYALAFPQFWIILILFLLVLALLALVSEYK